MCGLVGVFGNVSQKAEDVFNDLLQVDVIRGKDSTGVALVGDMRKNPKIYKDSVLPGELLHSKGYIKATKGAYYSLMMGHNRAATMGSITWRNAHPFTHGDITLCHNGTIHSKWELPDQAQFETDSEAITNSINEIGIAATWELIDGAATLTYWNRDNYSFNIVSNNKRPFFWVRNAAKDTIVWSSEDWILRGVTTRNEFKLEDGKNVWFPNKNTHYEFFIDNASDKIIMETTKLKPYVRVWGRWNKKFDRNTFATPDQYGLSDTPDSADGWEEDWNFSPDTPKMIINNDNLSRPIDINMTKEEFREIYKNCIFCEDSLKDKYDTVGILDNNIAVCETCEKIADMNQIDILKEVEM